MSRTKFFINNVFSMALQQMVTAAAYLIIPRLIITAYGSDVNGLVVSATQFISYLALVEAGISGAAIYELYKPLAERDMPRINGILSASNISFKRSGYIFVILLALLAFFYPYIAGSSPLSAWQTALVVLSLGAYGAADFFTAAKYRTLLFADQKSYTISSANIAYQAFRILIVAAAVIMKADIVTMLLMLILSVFLRSAMLKRFAKKHYPSADYKAAPDMLSIKERWSVLYLQLLNGAQYSIPIIIATLFTTLRQVSVYSVYYTVISGIYGILGIFVSGLIASFGNALALKEKSVLQKTVQEFESFYYMLITVVYSAALVMILPFIVIYTSGITDADYIIPSTAFLFVLNGILSNLKTPQITLIHSAGMFRQTRVQTTVQMLIAILGGLLFVQFWGIEGILIALILSNIYRTIDLLFFVPKHITGLKYTNSLKRMLLTLFNFSLASLIFFFRPVECSNVLQWLLYACATIMIFSVWTLASNMLIDAKSVKDLFTRLKRMLIKKTV